MTENEKKKPQTAKVGAVIDVPKGAEVVRPDGSKNTVHGTSYVLDVAGKFFVNGEAVTAK